jgi:signal transduction histidine kinase
VVVDVADDGPGMRLEVAEKIFNPFFTTKQQGSGLGLAIVRKIIDAHEGRIEVTSAEGRGTRFRVTLPVDPPPRVEPLDVKKRED